MTKQQKLVLWVSILASMVAAIDGFIVNVALPAIGRDLGGGLAVQQWTVDAYLLTLGALILVAGSLSDLFGRKRILWWGLVGFGGEQCRGAYSGARRHSGRRSHNGPLTRYPWLAPGACGFGCFDGGGRIGFGGRYREPSQDYGLVRHVF